MAGHLTLAIVKPHIHYKQRVGEIIKRVEEADFKILLCKVLQLLPDGAQEFYGEHKGKPFFDNLVKVMSSGPIWVMVLHKPNAVEEWRNLIGSTNPAQAAPGTIRHDFGDHSNMTNNAVHGSSDDWAAKREINFFFNREIRVAEEVDKMLGPNRK